MKSEAYVYILRCADGSLYTGWTNNPARRLAAHNAGTASRCTRARRPVEMIYLEERADRADALRREAQIKRLNRAQKLALIDAAQSAPDAQTVVPKGPQALLNSEF